MTNFASAKPEIPELEILRKELQELQELQEAVANEADGGLRDRIFYLNHQIEALDPYKRVPEDRLPELDKALDKLNKRAAKVGALPVGYTIENREVEEFWYNPMTRESMSVEAMDFDPHYLGFHRRVRTWCNIKVIGQACQFGGWTFVATLEHTPAGNLLRAVPELPNNIPAIPSEFRHTGANRCDHCEARRRRKNTFLVWHEEEGWKQIGRQCLSLFFPGINPAQVAQFFTSLKRSLEYAIRNDEEWEAHGGSRWIPEYDIELILTLAAHSIRKNGWFPSKFEESTVGTVRGYLNPPPYDPKHCQSREEYDAQYKPEPTEQDKQLAHDTITWVEGLNTEGNDYLHNLAVIVANKTVGDKQLGFAVSAVSSYQREMGKLVKREAERKAGSNSDFVGVVGKRQDFGGVITDIRNGSGQYGTWFLTTVMDDDGNALKYFNALGDAEVGDRVSFAATVKKHEEFRGTKQTMLQRATKIKIVKRGEVEDREKVYA